MSKVRPEDPSKLTDFKVLTFDVYSTLIDEASGMHNALEPLLSQLPSTHPFSSRPAALAAFSAHEHGLQQSQPTLPYAALLSQAYASFAESLSLSPPGDAACDVFARSIGLWLPFEDTIAALQSLHKHYKLVLLSNIDNVSITRTLSGPLREIQFDYVYTAENIGSYKPSLKNFEYLVEHVKKDLGLEKEQILHTANSLRADHVPAKEMGLTSAWIDRGEGEEESKGYEGKVAFTWRWATMGDMAREVDLAFAGVGR